MAGVTYDTGVLIAADHNDPRTWELHLRNLQRGIQPTVPAGVLAEAWRGDGEQANLELFLLPCEIDPLDDRRARAIGAALSITQTSDVIDASVVVGAAIRGDTIVTSDASTLRAVSDALQIDIEFLDI